MQKTLLSAEQISTLNFSTDVFLSPFLIQHGLSTFLLPHTGPLSSALYFTRPHFKPIKVSQVSQ